MGIPSLKPMAPRSHQDVTMVVRSLRAGSGAESVWTQWSSAHRPQPEIPNVSHEESEWRVFWVKASSLPSPLLTSAAGTTVWLDISAPWSWEAHRLVFGVYPFGQPGLGPAGAKPGRVLSCLPTQQAPQDL